MPKEDKKKEVKPSSNNGVLYGWGITLIALAYVILWFIPDSPAPQQSPTGQAVGGSQFNQQPLAKAPAPKPYKIIANSKEWSAPVVIDGRALAVTVAQKEIPNVIVQAWSGNTSHVYPLNSLPAEGFDRLQYKHKTTGDVAITIHLFNTEEEKSRWLSEP